MLYSFKNDYSEWAHPAILDALKEMNFQQEDGYWNDSFSQNARKYLHRQMEDDKPAIHFVSWGTQANLLCLAAFLRPYESIIAANTAHIAVHEAGAIEATWHKIHTITTSDGKLNPDLILPTITEHKDEHMVKPKLVFISQTTEVWSVYTKDEIRELSDFCKEHNLWLYMDWARLWSALTSLATDIDLPTITKLVDAYYIWGTKNGALLGEAIVLCNESLHENFRYHMKQRWALLAKWRLVWLQFSTLFENTLFFDLWKHANTMAQKLADGISQKWYTFLSKPVSNQIFPILPHDRITQLEQKFGFYIWKPIDEKSSAIRLVTSWATPKEMVGEFLRVL